MWYKTLYHYYSYKELQSEQQLCYTMYLLVGNGITGTKLEVMTWIWNMSAD